ncbi:MAG: YeeE/YedE family protein [Polyangiaceae bacterium]|nr:YeeE/YedE family protein [Myxococcales bacterium]MCB9586141.1 YeeE/YedE family protein [Polyangiaceae bacterium]MCB9606819.1 YeeE/YedE family protein [Polyangiaceae bacterium]
MWSYLSLIGAGVLFGAAAGSLLIVQGRIAGISGIAAKLLDGPAVERRFAAVFMLGLLFGGGLLRLFMPRALADSAPAPVGLMVLAGLLLGLGARVGNGCTSGHGVCGVGRFSLRSCVAVGTFTGVGMLVRSLLVAGGWS